jgi:hypothetical protein
MPLSTLQRALTVLAASALIAGTRAADGPPLAVVPYAPDSGTVTVRCGKLIDGLRDSALENAVVVITRGRVSYAGPASAAPVAGPVLDLP